MVEQIYDEKALIRELTIHGEMSLTLTLEKEAIEEWKRNGNFAFLRKELINLPKVKFACVQFEDECCSYHFILNTKELAGRVLTMMREMYAFNKHVSLVKCYSASLGDGSPVGRGTVKACSLF